MHHHPDQTEPLWKVLLASVPVVGAFFNNRNTNYLKAADQAAGEVCSVVMQTSAMYLLPIEMKGEFLTMDVKMGTAMGMRMWLGDIVGRGIYTFSSQSLKECFKFFFPNSFPTTTPCERVIEMAQLLPLIGPFLGADHWKESLKRGLAGNVSQLTMITGGTIMMMLSPRDMKEDAGSVAITTLLMISGMTAAMLVQTLLQVAAEKSFSNCAHLSFWKRKELGNEGEKKQLLLAI